MNGLPNARDGRWPTTGDHLRRAIGSDVQQQRWAILQMHWHVDAIHSIIIIIIINMIIIIMDLYSTQLMLTSQGAL